MEFRILGPLEAWEGGAPVAIGGAKQRALLAIFLLHANQVVSIDRLINALWEEPPANATKAVQVYVSRLRKTLGGSIPMSRPPGYLLGLLPEQLDLARFRRLRDEARRKPAIAAEKLEEALALWRGVALAEFADEPFARAERLRLEEERLEALGDRIDADLALGRHAALVGELEALVATYRLHEGLRGQLMLALYRSGRQAEALAAFREGRRELVEELGIEPGRALQQLHLAMLHQDAALELEPSTTATGASVPAPAPTQSAPPRLPSAPPLEVREERKVVSVLFVEPVSAAAAREADPEDLRTALRPFYAVVKREIERFGGNVESLVGTIVTAVFGARMVHEDDPERAVRAALEIRRGISESPGEVVSSAQRLQVAVPVSAILVGEQTYRTTREVIDYSEAAPTAAKAGAGAILAWQALAALPRRGVDLVREPRTPLVGRKRELELLVSTLTRAIEERSPQFVTLVGVPGIGKSRLVFELSKRFDQEREQITWRQGRCLSYGDGVSFWALGEIVKAQAGILESDRPDQAEEKLRTAVAALPLTMDEATWVEREIWPLIGSSGERGPEERSEERFRRMALLPRGHGGAQTARACARGSALGRRWAA